MDLLVDFPRGPLDRYRKSGSFDWKKMKVFYEGEQVVKYKNELYQVLEKHFDPKPPSTLAEQRRRTRQQLLFINNSDLFDIDKFFGLREYKIATEAFAIAREFSPECSVLLGARSLFVTTITNMGTERHHKFIKDEKDGKIIGSFALTEVMHGSNTKMMQVRATYCKERGQFILSSPNFGAAKCWSGSLGQVATHTIIFAQLYVNGQCHGLHFFIVPIRDPNSLVPYSGVIVGDMGEKIGLNGIDNGFIVFDNYGIPRENLLNKDGDVTAEGIYVQRFKGSRKVIEASTFAALSSGRIAITAFSPRYAAKALTIAIRYAAVRNHSDSELPLLEYQDYQYRLFPYLAAFFVIYNGSKYLCEARADLIHGTRANSPDDENLDMLLGLELHVLSSASKPLSSWTFRDAIQESLEMCGSHGCLKLSGLPDLKNDQDAESTYEGDNHVLLQQTSRFLERSWSFVESQQQIQSPLQSADFLSNAPTILCEKFTANTLEDLYEPQTIIDAFQWLTVYLLQQTTKKLESLKNRGISTFNARNESQVYYSKTLSIVYIQHFFLQRMSVTVNSATDLAIKKVFANLLALYGLWSLEKYLGYLYEGGYATGSEPADLIHEGILKLCANLKNDAISLVDVIAPPDFILNSVLGASDGEVYKRLQSAIFQNPYCMSRPDWWQEIINWQDIKPKL